MRTLILCLFAVAAAGCTEQKGLDCPANTNLIGTYVLSFAPQHDAGVECIAVNDAGVKTALTLDDAGTQGATFCVGTGSDGGPQLSLLVGGKGVRKSDLKDEGKFHFVTDPTVAQNTACLCDVSDSETFDGRLITSNDGGFALLPDGGLPVVSAVSATLTDTLTPASGATGCACAFPCTLTYSISGSRF